MERRGFINSLVRWTLLGSIVTGALVLGINRGVAGKCSGCPSVDDCDTDPDSCSLSADNTTDQPAAEPGEEREKDEY